MNTPHYPSYDMRGSYKHKYNIDKRVEPLSAVHWRDFHFFVHGDMGKSINTLHESTVDAIYKNDFCLKFQ